MRIETIVIMSLFLFIGCSSEPIVPIKHKRGVKAKEIAAYYEQNNQDAKKCFQNIKRSGRLTIVWQLDHKANVLDPYIKDDSLLDGDVNSCLLDHLKTLSFPNTFITTKATVEYTYQLDPTDHK